MRMLEEILNNFFVYKTSETISKDYERKHNRPYYTNAMNKLNKGTLHNLRIHEKCVKGNKKKLFKAKHSTV